MTILSFPHWVIAGGGTPHSRQCRASDRSAAPVEATQGGLLQFQLRRLISEILADPALDPDMYFSLIEHLAESPGHPEQALLAHLRDVQDPADLPPYNARRKPPMLPAEP